MNKNVTSCAHGSWLCWSYDPRTEKLDVWDSNKGREGHYERTGNDGYGYCAQGRMYPGTYNTIYNNRPIRGKYPEDPEPDPASVREEAQKLLKQYMTDNHMQSVVTYENS